MTGSFDAASASRIVSAETWDRSTIMPMRFISATISRPRIVQAVPLVLSDRRVANSLVLFQVSVM